jgi:hypothetical protein
VVGRQAEDDPPSHAISHRARAQVAHQHERDDAGLASGADEVERDPLRPTRARRDPYDDVTPYRR